jgi:hypothetical protein
VRLYPWRSTSKTVSRFAGDIEMAESHLTYDIIPNVDKHAYIACAKKTICTVLQQANVIEFRSYRNWNGKP